MSTTSPSGSYTGPRLRAGAIQNPYPSIGAVNLEAQVEDAAAGLLHEVTYSHPFSPVEELPDPATCGLEVDKLALEEQLLERVARPWWQRPSATWFIVLSPLSMLAGSALVAPRLQLYTYLMCKDLGDPTYGRIRSVGSTSTHSIPCAADPVVQANVAKFLTITATVQGVLSCLTATYWGSFSDRYGRVKFLGLNITTLLLADAALAALAVAPESVPGGYWFLLLTSAFEGLIGGSSAAHAALHAYLADCSSPATRSAFVLSRLDVVPNQISQITNILAISWANFYRCGIRADFGGIASRLSGNPYIIFYLAIGLHTINAFFQWFVIPESLLPAQMDAARRARKGRGKGHRFSRVFSFLGPLSVLAPLPPKGGVNPQEVLKKDWSLTWLALSLAPESLLIGGMQYWLQYAAGKFYWSAEMVGYYISVIGFTRALFLAIGLPAILRLYAPKSHPIQLPISPAGDEPLNVDSSLPPAADARGSGSPHTPTVDLSVARISLVVQMICFVIIAFSKDASMFVAAGALGALATGYSPTTHSLSLELYTRRGGLSSEAGRLFGAMSVIQTVGNQVVGPSLFGIVYIKTVSTFPETIFYVSVAVVLLSLFFLSLVRIPPYRGVIDAEVEGSAVIDVPTIIMNDE